MDIASLRAQHPDHWKKAAAIRVLTLDAVAAANSGHSGMPMGMADVATVLFEKHLNFDASAPDWPNRDRFILSAGHGSMLIYSLLHLTGYADMTLDQVKNFRQWGAITAGHPEYGHAKGVETTTGPLGQGISNAVGFAMAEESLRARWGAKVMDHYTYVIAGDGCLMEGVSQEAIGLAGKHELSRLIVLWDNNGITIDGKVSLSDITDQKARFAASGWDVFECDGHDPVDIDRAITAAKASPRPAMIACATHIALGSSAQDTSKGHGALTDKQLIADTRAAYGWTHGPFEIPADIKAAWEAIGARGIATRRDWEGRMAMLPAGKQAEFTRIFARDVPNKLAAAIRAVKKSAVEEAPKLATRSASEKVLAAVNPILTETIGGSADLTGSNNTKTADLGVFEPGNRKGRYVYYGIREHGMAAAMNGMVLHGGVRPYSGTFMCFTDYARPAMRLSALMQVPVVYVMTHDCIGLGEDGPTHQPVEHLAISRATPNTWVFRPADLVETAEAWEVGLHQQDHPFGAGTEPTEPADGAENPQQSEPDRQRCLCAGRGHGQASGHPDGHRVRGGNRAESPRRAGSRRDRHAGRLDPLHGAVPRPGRGVSPQGSARRPGSGGDRGRRPHGLGLAVAGRTRPRGEGRFRRHEQLRCLRPGRSALQGIRHHRRKCRGKGKGAAGGLKFACDSLAKPLKLR